MNPPIDNKLVNVKNMIKAYASSGILPGKRGQEPECVGWAPYLECGGKTPLNLKRDMSRQVKARTCPRNPNEPNASSGIIPGRRGTFRAGDLLTG